jgi:rubredoxin
VPSQPRHRCSLCDRLATVLLTENPDTWICPECSDRLGREWLARSSLPSGPTEKPDTY